MIDCENSVYNESDDFPEVRDIVNAGVTKKQINNSDKGTTIHSSQVVELQAKIKSP